MSLDAMTTITAQAHVRRRRGRPMTPESTDLGRSVTATAAVSDVARAIVTYIPIEVVTVYVIALGALSDSGELSSRGRWVVMWLVLAMTPLVVWALYAGKLKAAGDPLPLGLSVWPWADMCLASMAFLLWAFSLPDSPFHALSWYRPGMAAVALSVGTTLLGLIAPLARPRAYRWY